MKIIKKYSGRNTKGYQIKTDCCGNFFVYRYTELMSKNNDIDQCRQDVKTFTDKRLSALL